MGLDQFSIFTFYSKIAILICLIILIISVSEAKKYHAERKQYAQTIEAQNSFESYAYNLLNVVQVSFSVCC
jgi:hypothetical protein